MRVIEGDEQRPNPNEGPSHVNGFCRPKPPQTLENCSNCLRVVSLRPFRLRPGRRGTGAHNEGAKEGAKGCRRAGGQVKRATSSPAEGRDGGGRRWWPSHEPDPSGASQNRKKKSEGEGEDESRISLWKPIVDFFAQRAWGGNNGEKHPVVQ